jgi:hypothetical protein
MKLHFGRVLGAVAVASLMLVAGAQGATWALKTTPLPSGGKEGTLRAVSCVTNFCAAVGDFWNGTIWGASGDELGEAGTWFSAKIEANHGPKNGDLRSVTCWSTKGCRAAGAYGTTGGAITSLIEGKEGENWKYRESPSPSGEEGNTAEFRGISCLSAGSYCLAAGQFSAPPGKEATFAAEWNGEAWVRSFPIENPGKKSHGHFVGVSCIEAKPEGAEDVCIAAGAWGREVAGKEIIQAGSETWNTKTAKWAAIEAEEPSTTENGNFYAVSCKSVTFCLAVGNWKEIETGRTRILADIWNGTKWSVVLSSGPGGAFVEGTLRGVSCTAVEECEAVGDYINSSGKEIPLAYLWKEKKWEVQTTETPAGATGSALEGVSCTAAETCEAVGTESTSTATFLPFAEVL